MTPIRKVAAFRLDDDLRDGLQRIWLRDGIQPSEQVRRAVRAWLEMKGELPIVRKPPLTAGAPTRRRRS